MSAKTADKVASYFGVSVGYLLGTETTETELIEYLEEMRTRPEQRMLFSTTKDCMKEKVKHSWLSKLLCLQSA